MSQLVPSIADIRADIDLRRYGPKPEVRRPAGLIPVGS